MNKGRFTAEEDAILTTKPLAEAAKLLPHRSYTGINQRRYKLRRLKTLTEKNDKPITPKEIKWLLRYFEVMPTPEFIFAHMPDRSFDFVAYQARKRKLKKIFCGTTADLYTDHLELIDQIRMRAKADGFSFRKLDQELNAGGYFSKEAGNKRMEGKRKVNMQMVLRAVEFFGGKLVIDWNDR